jgi:DNA polymerase III alpha subunit (gram-positive type)|tara:strand:+ start:90 stop:377 length:288 start_codon:yes stop_codon:yes gene_type:complete
MRNWYKYLILDKFINNIDDRFLFSNYQLIENNRNFKDIFNFENFKKNKIFFKQYNFLKNNLDPDKETLFIGSSWGESEFFLKDEFKITASDSEDE